MDCNICNQQSDFLFEAGVLRKYVVKYFKCRHCGFIQTEAPYWLGEAYAAPIGLIDVGLLQRNLLLSEKVSGILDSILPFDGTYLDYGGGYGTFVRLMRDRGYNFYLSEIYTQNLFAKYFELGDLEIKTGFTCLTAFEVFEHLSNPIDDVQKMFVLSDIIIFSTELQPNDTIKSPGDWWYFVPEAGQHVSLYSLNSLMQLKKHFNCYLYTDSHHLHILSKIPLKDPFANVAVKHTSVILKIKNKLFKTAEPQAKTIKRESLLQKDFEYYKNKLPDD